MELNTAIRKANEFQKLIAPYCDHVQVADNMPERQVVKLLAAAEVF